VTTHRVYDAFGNLIETASGSVSLTDLAFAYTGRMFDSETGLQNNSHRWYDPATGRWISEDPIGFAAGDANLYRYVGNGVTGATDPSGLDEKVLFPVEFESLVYLNGTLGVGEDSNGIHITMTLERVQSDVIKEQFEQWGVHVQALTQTPVRQYDGWRWPHLYKLLDGSYGGRDPGRKGRPYPKPGGAFRENDYTPIVVRSYEGTRLTSERISHKWHQVGGEAQISHVARSETFDVNPSRDCEKGVIEVWLVQLDTMHHSPAGAPREFDGYSLAYFSINWERHGRGFITSTTYKASGPATSIDWLMHYPDTYPPDVQRPMSER
jgi:RHS repeat-associated protein